MLYPIILIFRAICTKNVFFKMISRNVVFVEIFILSDIWTNNDFSEWSQYNVIFSKCWYFCTYGQKAIFSKNPDKSTFFSNCDIIGYMGKKLFFEMISQNMLYPVILIFSKLSQKNCLFLEMFHLRRLGIFRIKGDNQKL